MIIEQRVTMIGTQYSVPAASFLAAPRLSGDHPTRPQFKNTAFIRDKAAVAGCLFGGCGFT